MITRRTYQMDGEPQNGNATPPTEPTTDLAGYPTTDELVKGYRNSSAEAQRQKARADAYEVALAANQQYQPPQRQATPYDRLNEFGIPVDALREAVRSEIREEFAPLARGMNARNEVIARNPDYVKFEADTMKFINADPDTQRIYNEAFSTNPVVAAEWALLKFTENQRRTQPPEPNGNPSKQQKADAQIPNSRSTESRERNNVGDDQASKAWEHFQKTGDPAAFAKTRLRQVISKEFLDGSR